MITRDTVATNPRATSDERHAALRAMLERDRESAWEIAQYERGQRDEYTSKLRFGLAALNAASMVTVLNVGGAMSGVGPGALLTSAAFFLAGTVFAGYSLFAHQTHLIELTGFTGSRALILDRAVAIATFEPGTREHEALGPTMEEAAAVQSGTYGFSSRALTCQGFAASSWIGGVAVVGVAKALTFLPPSLAEWIGM